MSDQLDQHHARVQQGIEERNAHKKALHTCPVCLSNDPVVMPMGGPGSYWFEHACGAYSPIKPTLEQAIAATDEWQVIDPEVNQRMYPPVGG